MTRTPVGRGMMMAWLALGLAGCARKQEDPANQAGAGGVPVRVGEARSVAWDRTVTIVGTLFAKDTATLAAEVDGAVEQTLVDFGDRFGNDQELARIDTASYGALLDQAIGNMAKAQANLTNALRNFERLSTLKASGIASDSEFDQARSQADQWRAEVAAAQGALRVAQLNVQRSKVRAPFTGAVARRTVGRGDYVKVGSPLFEIVDDAVLKFIFLVPERYASFVEKRLPVRFSVDNFPGEIFQGTTYLISPAVSSSSRSFPVGALVTNATFRLKANTYARGELVLERGVSTLVVPVEAIVSFAGVTKVFVIADALARSRGVVLGRVREGLQEVVSGVKPGEKVAISGMSKLSDGARVRLLDPADALPAQGVAAGQGAGG